MRSPGRAPVANREHRLRFWEQIAGGATSEDAGVGDGVSPAVGTRWFREAGGVMPAHTEPGRVRPRLTFAQREEIAALFAAGESPAAIAREIGCHRSTVGRELQLNSKVAKYRPMKYRASVAQKQTDWRARRPKQTKLGGNPRLCDEVQDRLTKEHSPAQIAQRLQIDFPDDEQMQVSHESIYRALYVQGRGALRRDLHQRLRTGRALRKPRRTVGERRGKLPDMVNIADRPPEVEDRAVPGHWEGDLIVGAHSQSAIGTLAERMTGFCLLLHLPDSHGADAVQEAMVQAMSALPETLRRTLTWDQGSEMANHAQIAAATDLEIYFCDPHSPWQRGTNENTNGLLRQYFPKGADLSVFGPDYLDHVAHKLNNRPRKRLGFKTPAEALDELLSDPHNPSVVASTA